MIILANKDADEEVVKALANHLARHTADSRSGWTPDQEDEIALLIRQQCPSLSRLYDAAVARFRQAGERQGVLPLGYLSAAAQGDELIYPLLAMEACVSRLTPEQFAAYADMGAKMWVADREFSALADALEAQDPVYREVHSWLVSIFDPWVEHPFGDVEVEL